MPTAEQFSDVAGRHGIGNANEVIVYSAGGVANAARLCLMFLAMGHRHVRLLNGGWEKWIGEGRPVSDRPSEHEPVHFAASLEPGWFLDKDAMVQALGESSSSIIMALPAEVYRGERVIFSRPGRIPGSLSIPAGDLLSAQDGTFLPADLLEAKLAPAIAAGRTINYCGAGMTAAVNAFAFRLLGYENVAVYDGSMLEWTADASLPLEPAV